MEDEFRVNVEEFSSFANHNDDDDGYERLHDEEMDQISVSVHSDCEGIFAKCSQTNLIESGGKMKISLSQEQLKLNSNKNNFLTVPSTSKKSRSLSFSVGTIKIPNSESIDMLKIEPMPSSSSVSEIIYAVPQKPKKVSIDDGCMIESMTTAPSTPEVTFKHPLKFYCKICNDIFKDPRTLNCLHTFCCQCLAQLDATNDLQNNQFWRKISDVSCE